MEELRKAVEKLNEIDFSKLQEHMGMFQEDAEVADVQICGSGCIANQD